MINYENRGLNRHRCDAIEQAGGQRILDIGCGNGAYVLAFKDQRDIHGVDYRHFEAWNAAPERFMVSDAQKIALPDGNFDTVTSFETLEHLPDPTAALREFHRLTRGNLIITVPNCALTEGMKRSGLIYNHWIDPTHVNFWTMDEICLLVEQCGFKVRERKHINKVNIAYLMFEALGLPEFLSQPLGRLFGLLQRNCYQMTTLVIADKIS